VCQNLTSFPLTRLLRSRPLPRGEVALARLAWFVKSVKSQNLLRPREKEGARRGSEGKDEGLCLKYLRWFPLTRLLAQSTSPTGRGGAGARYWSLIIW
jgi:hypothetical protein